MICRIRKWKLSDATDLAMAISNKKLQNNLRDGVPYPIHRAGWGKFYF